MSLLYIILWRLGRNYIVPGAFWGVYLGMAEVQDPIDHETVLLLQRRVSQLEEDIVALDSDNIALLKAEDAHLEATKDLLRRLKALEARLPALGP